MNEKNQTPAIELSDNNLLRALSETAMGKQAACGYPSPKNLLELAHAIIAADRALRAVPAGDVVMPVVAWQVIEADGTKEAYSFKPNGSFLIEAHIQPAEVCALVKQADAQAALAAQAAEIARLTAERDALKREAVRYHWLNAKESGK